MQVLSPLDSAHSRAGGFTVLEIVITFVMLGIATALIAPALLPRTRTSTSTTVEAVIETARRTAIERAEPLTLSLAANGSWVVEARGLPPREGTMAWRPPAAFRLHISALGACTLEANAGVMIDPVHCTLRE